MSITSTGPRSAPPLTPGERVGGKYRVSRLLGQGGMGAVYLVTHETLETVFALKLLSRGSEMHQARFVREARILASLRSEHVAKVVDFGVMEEFGAPYMVMEYLPGADLSAHLDSVKEPLGVRESVDHILEACEALAEAHREGIIHRDVKPSNLFLTTRFDGSPMVKVLDFGIAKTDDRNGDASALTATEMVFGSPAYMSPEQVRSSKQVGPQTDIWSLALALYELVTKKHPFQGDSPASIVAAIAADEPRPLPPELGPNLWAALEPALRKDPRERPPTIAAFANRLAPFGGERSRIVLTRIERLSHSSASASQATRAMISGPPTGPSTTSRSPGRPSQPSIPDGPPPASARTTYGPQSRPKRPPTALLALGGVAVVALGAVLGMRAQSKHSSSSETTGAAASSSVHAAPEPPVSVAVQPVPVPSAIASSSAWTPAPEPSAAKELPAAKAGGTSSTPKKGGGSKPASSAPKAGPSAPRGDVFN